MLLPKSCIIQFIVVCFIPAFIRQIDSNEEHPKFFLGSVEKNIMSLIQNGNLTGIAHALMTSISTYNKFLTDILVQCKGEDFGELMLAKSLCDSGGPQILKHEFNHSYLKDSCGWSEIEILDLRNIMSDTMVLWQNFKRYANFSR